MSPLFTREEVEVALNGLVNSRVESKRQSAAFRQFGNVFDPRKISLLPIGLDGQTTIHLFKNEDTTRWFVNEILRITSEPDKDNNEVPKMKFKKFKVCEFETQPGRTRKIVIPCLRDQVVVRCILNRLRQIGLIVDEADKPNQNIPALAGKIIALVPENEKRKVIRTDIQDFYSTVCVKRLLELLNESHGQQIGGWLMGLIKEALSGNQTAVAMGYTGLPVGMGISGLLANYYVSRMGLTTFCRGVEVIRYEDDLLLVFDPTIDPKKVMKMLDKKLHSFGLVRNKPKTEVLDSTSAFVFVGVTFEKGRAFISKERFAKWVSDVKKDVNDELRNYRRLELLRPDIERPSRREVVERTWKAHKRGNRSYFYQHMLKIQAL